MLGQIDINDFVRSRYALGAVSMATSWKQCSVDDDTLAQVNTRHFQPSLGPLYHLQLYASLHDG